MTIEADPRLVETLINSTGVKDERPLTSIEEDEEEKLDTNLTSKCRADAARLKYVAADRPDIALSVKELARRMSEPTKVVAERVRRFVRYLRFKPGDISW